jgi:hypothetical protein
LSELAVVCLLQVVDDDLLQVEHGVCHSFGFFRVRVIHQLAQRGVTLSGIKLTSPLTLVDYARKAGINPDELAVQNRSAWVLPMDANGDQLSEMLTLHRQAGLDHPKGDAHKGKKRGIDSMCPKGGWCTHRLMGVEQA